MALATGNDELRTPEAWWRHTSARKIHVGELKEKEKKTLASEVPTEDEEMFCVLSYFIIHNTWFDKQQKLLCRLSLKLRFTALFASCCHSQSNRKVIEPISKK